MKYTIKLQNLIQTPKCSVMDSVINFWHLWKTFTQEGKIYFIHGVGLVLTDIFRGMRGSAETLHGFPANERTSRFGPEVKNLRQRLTCCGPYPLTSIGPKLRTTSHGAWLSYRHHSSGLNTVSITLVDRTHLCNVV